MKTDRIHTPTQEQPNEPDWLEIVRRKVGSLRFGVVQVIVHEGRVTQIESTEKTRLESRPAQT